MMYQDIYNYICQNTKKIRYTILIIVVFKIADLPLNVQKWKLSNLWLAHKSYANCVYSMRPLIDDSLNGFPFFPGMEFDIPWVFSFDRHYGDNERDGVLNHRRLDCLINCSFRRRSKKTSKLRVTGLCKENPPVTGGFPSQRASNAENVSIWRRHHGFWFSLRGFCFLQIQNWFHFDGFWFFLGWSLILPWVDFLIFLL